MKLAYEIQEVVDNNVPLSEMILRPLRERRLQEEMCEQEYENWLLEPSNFGAEWYD